jgi:flagellar assembly factor FliW
MIVESTRFGALGIRDEEVLLFEQGLIGMESCRRWVLLADAANKSLAWLQSVDRSDIALAVVSPRRYVKDYQVRVNSRDLLPLALDSVQDAQVLVVLNKHGSDLTLNLKAPLVVNLKNHRGRQVIAKNDHDLQYLLGATVPLRRSA